MGILNAHIMDTGNIGDIFSGPWRYFPELQMQPVEFHQFGKGSMVDGHVVIGGGGLFHQDEHGVPVDHVIELRQLLSSTKGMRIGWGLGTMYEDNSLPAPPNEFKGQWELLGLRDWRGPKYIWVPCASCMHPIFDQKFQTETRVVVYSHNRHPIPRGKLPHRMNTCPKNADYNQVFRETIKFLSMGQVVVTSSFHGAYWATLLGRGVVVVPWASKFYTLKHPPVFTTAERWLNEVGNAPVYPGALEECREANRSFAATVKELCSE